MADYETNWDKHNARTPFEKRTDIMTQCFHSQITPGNTARILFAAGYTLDAVRVRAFFVGRQKWLDEKKMQREANS